GSGAGVPPAAGASRPRIRRGRDARDDSRDGCPTPAPSLFIVPMHANYGVAALHEPHLCRPSATLSPRPGRGRKRGEFKSIRHEQDVKEKRRRAVADVPRSATFNVKRSTFRTQCCYFAHWTLDVGRWMLDIQIPRPANAGRKFKVPMHAKKREQTSDESPLSQHAA